jgi:hypothetical protein
MMSNGEPTDDMFNLVLNLGLILLPAIVLYNVKFVIGRILSNGRESECDLDCSDCSDETVKPTLTQTTQTCEIDSGSESDDESGESESDDESGSESDGINDIINKFKTDDDDIFMTELNEHINTILKDLD